jgi:anti-sigma factor RsiW
MNEMTCRSGVELLMEYLEGTLAPEPRAALETHVAGCPRCTAFLASYRETPRILREVTARRLSREEERALQAFLRARLGAPPKGG